MASRIHMVWATCWQTNTSVSPKSLVSGGNRQHLMEHCPGPPSPLLRAPGGRGKKEGEELKRNWKRRGRGERQGGKGERDSTRWIMQSCQRRLLLEVLAVLKGASPDLHQLHQPLSPLPMAESRLICAPANGQQQGEEGGWWGGRVGPLGDSWIVLEGHTGNDKCALYYRYLQRSPTGRSELPCTAAPRKYNYRTKA